MTWYGEDIGNIINIFLQTTININWPAISQIGCKFTNLDISDDTIIQDKHFSSVRCLKKRYVNSIVSNKKTGSNKSTNRIRIAFVQSPSASHVNMKPQSADSSSWSCGKFCGLCFVESKLIIFYCQNVFQGISTGKLIYYSDCLVISEYHWEAELRNTSVSNIISYTLYILLFVKFVHLPVFWCKVLFIFIFFKPS